MQNIVNKIYYVFWAIFFILFLVLFAFFDLNIKNQNVKEGYEILTSYEKGEYEDSALPAGVRYTYSFILDDVKESYCHLLVYSAHQEVNIFLGEQCIYRMKAHEIAMSGSTPGHVWNQVSFSEADNGKGVTVEIIPVYDSAVGVDPVLYWGSKSSIVQDVVVKALPIVVMSFLTMMVGIVYICFILWNYKKSDAERSLMMLGFFAIQVSLWKVTDTSAINLILPGNPVLSQVPYMALMLMCVSFTLFIKELYSTRNHIIWYIPVFFGFVNMGLSLLFQYQGIADMRQMLPVTHVNIILLIAIAIIMTVYEVWKAGWNARLKRNILCMCACFVGAAADMVVYYAFNGYLETALGMVGFMTYIVVMGLESIKEIKKLLAIGAKAQQYEQLAYHDQLTGLYNRAAFAEHTEDSAFVQEKCVIIVMDLNNLKVCNDNLGHAKGDIYIKTCADIIHEFFGDIGRCYRVGGDEFHVLLTNGDLHLCEQRLQALKERIANCDKIDGFRMGIACGYKMYDRRLDYDINATARRADRQMYQEKFAMKEL